MDRGPTYHCSTICRRSCKTWVSLCLPPVFAINRLLAICSVAFLCATTQPAIANTLVGRQFYGVWSTASSTLQPARQVLKLSNDGGTWVMIDDQGRRQELALNKSSISIANDLLTVFYQNAAKGYALKLVLEGWGVGNYRTIFGTAFMYSLRKGSLQLFNGLPIAFQNGMTEMPPQTFWSFFLSDKPKAVSTSDIQELETSLKRINGIQITVKPDTEVYSLRRINSAITITQKGHPAYPSAIGVQLAPNRSAIKTSAQYAGNSAAFKKFYDEYLATLNEQKREARKHFDDLRKQIDKGRQ